jgi:hypothetical protein
LEKKYFWITTCWFLPRQQFVTVTTFILALDHTDVERLAGSGVLLALAKVTHKLQHIAAPIQQINPPARKKNTFRVINEYLKTEIIAWATEETLIFNTISL